MTDFSKPLPRDKHNAFTPFSKLAPAYSDIPEGAKRAANELPSRSLWSRLQSDWFFHGIKILKLQAKPGIDVKDARAHLSAVQSTCEPGHEYKKAAFIWLCEQWFDGATWEVDE